MSATVQMTGNVSGPDAPPPPASAPPARPEHVPEKFWNTADGTINTDALLSSYTELEKMKSKAPEGAAETPAEGAEGSSATPSEDEAREVASKAGVDFDALNAKFATSGSLEDADYTALETAGIPRAMVDAYIAGQTAIADQQRNALLAPVGGMDGYKAMTAWAAENLSAEDIAAYNAVVDGDNTAAAKMAIEGLHAKFKANAPQEPQLLAGGQTPAGDVYRSLEEMKADMRKPEYRKDQAFRDRVEAKLARSNV